MEEDRSDCPTGLYVRFVYDYNTQRADMFKDHVGYVNVYIYDEDGHKVAERSVANTNGDAPLSMYGYAMHFGTNELPTGRRYRLQAIAMQRQWDETLHTPGAKYRRTEVNDTASLRITLDHASTAIPGSQAGELYPVDNTAPLDTLWHTLKVTALDPTYGRQSPSMATTEKPYSIYPVEEQMVTVNEGYATYATLSLIRDTKHLNLTLFQTENPAEMDANDYEVGITDDNATLTSDNSVEPGDSLLYTPYAQWTSSPNTTEAMGHVQPHHVPHSRQALGTTVHTPQVNGQDGGENRPRPVSCRMSHLAPVELFAAGILRPGIRLRTQLLLARRQVEVLLHRHTRHAMVCAQTERGTVV